MAHGEAFSSQQSAGREEAVSSQQSAVSENGDRRQNPETYQREFVHCLFSFAFRWTMTMDRSPFTGGEARTEHNRLRLLPK